MRWKCLHKTALYILLAAVLLTACDRKAHNDGFCFPEGEGGLITGLITDESGVKVENAHLLVFDADDKLVSHEYFDDVRKVALHVKSLLQGRYTVLAVLNMPEDMLDLYTARSTLPDITLPGFIEWLKDNAPDYPDLLSGTAYADITEGEITRITITLYAGTDGITLPVLRLSLELPEPSLPDYTPTRTRSAETSYTLRCVVELYKPGTDERVLRKTVNPTLQNGRYTVEIAASQGEYDLLLWTDYARTDAPLTDTYYNTDGLRAVGIVTNPYTANTDGKDAAYYAQSVILPQEGATVNVQMQRPLAKYRILAHRHGGIPQADGDGRSEISPVGRTHRNRAIRGLFPFGVQHDERQGDGCGERHSLHDRYRRAGSGRACHRLRLDNGRRCGILRNRHPHRYGQAGQCHQPNKRYLHRLQTEPPQHPSWQVPHRRYRQRRNHHRHGLGGHHH